MNTIGIVVVTAFAANAAGGPAARMSDTGRRTTSPASRRQAIVLTIGEAVFDRDVAAADISGLTEPALERSHHVTGLRLRERAEEPDHRHCWRLRARRERP
jgi:hypothetical protein